MPRKLPEWVGSSPEASIPPRVRLRIFQRFDGRCQCGCNRKIGVGEAWDCDDRVALVNGGERREANLRPLLVAHHKIKNKSDLMVKSITYRKNLKHYGIKRKAKSRPIIGSRASGWKHRMDGSWVQRV